MKVYVVEFFGYDGGGSDSVWSTLEKAEERAAKLNAAYPSSAEGWDVVEYEIDNAEERK